MNEWRQTIIALGTALLSIIAIVTTLQIQFAGMRAAMRAEHDVVLVQMRDEHADIRMETRAGLDNVTLGLTGSMGCNAVNDSQLELPA